MSERLSLALETLSGDYDPSSEDGYISKCWLTYRAVDGVLSYDDWATKVRDVNPVMTRNGGLAVRWAVSQRMSEAYLFSKLDMSEDMLSRCSAIREIPLDKLMEWPAVMINVLRSTCLATAFCMHDNRPEDTGSWAIEAIEKWQSCTTNLMWKADPLCLVEFCAQLPTVHQLLCIAKKAGAIKFPSHPWVLKASPLPYGNTEFVSAMKKYNAPTWVD